MADRPMIPFEKTFDAQYGLTVVALDENEVRAEVKVTDAVKQPMGLVHGGLYASMAESMASWGTAHGAPAGSAVMGQSNVTNFLRPILEGTVHATARIRHRGRTTAIWDVEITDDDGRLCAMTRMTIAIRTPAPGDQPR